MGKTCRDEHLGLDTQGRAIVGQARPVNIRHSISVLAEKRNGYRALRSCEQYTAMESVAHWLKKICGVILYLIKNVCCSRNKKLIGGFLSYRTFDKATRSNTF